MATDQFDQEATEYEKLNVESIETSLELLEELCIKTPLRQEEAKRQITNYYNSFLKEKYFILDNLLLKMIDIAAQQNELTSWLALGTDLILSKLEDFL